MAEENINKEEETQEEKEKREKDQEWREMVVQSKREHWKYMLPLFCLQFGSGMIAGKKNNDSIAVIGIHLVSGTAILVSTVWLVYVKYYIVTKNVKRRQLWPGLVDRSIRLHYLAFATIIIVQIATKFIPEALFLSTIGIKPDLIHRTFGAFGLAYAFALVGERYVFMTLAQKYPETVKSIQQRVENIPILNMILNHF